MDKYLDLENSALSDFVNRFLTLPDRTRIDALAFPVDNRSKGAFDLNPSAPISLGQIEEEIEGPFRQVYLDLAHIPVVGELRDPAVLVANQAWCEYLARNVSPWHNCFASAGLIYFYRAITSDAYQTPGHMKLVYAVATAVEYVTSFTMIVDDVVDLTEERNGRTAWHRAHPATAYSDPGLLTVQARLIVESLIPATHPLRDDIVRTVDDYIRRSHYYFGYQAWSANARAAEAPELRRGYEPYGEGKEAWALFELLNEDTYSSWIWLRVKQYILTMIEVARLLACYEAITPISSIAYRRHIDSVSTVLSVLEDFADIETDTNEAPTDVMAGDTNVFLLCALQVRNSLENQPQREEFTAVMRAGFGAGSRDAAAEVIKLWRRHGVFARAVEFLNESVAEWRQAREEAARQCSAPAGLLAHLLAYMLLHDKDSAAASHLFRPESVRAMARDPEDLIEKITRASSEKFSQ
ncbi:hypothetical protein [Streptomyces spiramyceticus]|uniref:hypothetical protein n=1 Tax=Streptomyces spiramyceticus TaxID=299717 RepID=UPI00237BC58E|nr:hypothetical protein [Streptomyces spiramyceticus]